MVGEGVGEGVPLNRYGFGSEQYQVYLFTIYAVRKVGIYIV